MELPANSFRESVEAKLFLRATFTLSACRAEHQAATPSGQQNGHFTVTAPTIFGPPAELNKMTPGRPDSVKGDLYLSYTYFQIKHKHYNKTEFKKTMTIIYSKYITHQLLSSSYRVLSVGWIVFNIFI